VVISNARGKQIPCGEGGNVQRMTFRPRGLTVKKSMDREHKVIFAIKVKRGRATRGGGKNVVNQGRQKPSAYRSGTLQNQ